MKLKIIENNAYRMLGVYANASKKDIERNKSQFNAYLRVNRPIPNLPMDFTVLLDGINRDLESISLAEGDIAIPKSQLLYGLFWFVRTDGVDSTAFEYLTNGEITKAIDIWKEDGSASSLHNILICMLVQERYREAILLAHNIYTVHFENWKQTFTLLSEITPYEVSLLFLDTLYKELGKKITTINWEGLPKEWEKYIKDKAILPITEKIEKLLETCKKSNEGNPKLRYNDAFDLLEKVSPLLNELENLLVHDDIMLVSMEDKVYSEVLNCSIASYNFVYDELCNGEDSDYRQIVPLCNKLANLINVEFVSPTVAKRFAENKKIINEKCADIDKFIEETLAFSNQICWFCGAKGSTHEFKKPYSYSVSEPTWNGTKTTTYTKTVTIHICDDCQKELDEQIAWNRYTAAVVFVIAAIFLLLFFDFWIDFEILGWIFSIVGLGIASLLIGSWTSSLFRQLVDKNNIREFKRSLDDHPLVKYVKSEGYK